MKLLKSYILNTFCYTKKKCSPNVSDCACHLSATRASTAQHVAPKTTQGGATPWTSHEVFRSPTTNQPLTPDLCALLKPHLFRPTTITLGGVREVLENWMKMRLDSSGYCYVTSVGRDPRHWEDVSRIVVKHKQQQRAYCRKQRAQLCFWTVVFGF